MEVLNARAFLPFWNRRADRAAARHGLAAGAGSDEHRLRELGRAHVRLPSFRDADGFLEALAHAEARLVETTGPEGHLLAVGWKAARMAAAGAARLMPEGEPAGSGGGETLPAAS